MSRRFPFSVGVILLGMAQFAAPQSNTFQVPKTVVAGTAFSIQTSGSGDAVLYIVGPSQVLRRKLQLGQAVNFAADELHAAGHYVVFLTEESSSEQAELNVVAAREPASISFFAKPSRLPVDLRGAISGVVYVFDKFQNLILDPTPVSFQVAGEPVRMVRARDGIAWVKMDSATKSGLAKFQARAGDIAQQRIVQQVPGDPCNLKMSARPEGQRIALETEPVRDCRGNPVTDGTIVTFTENSDGRQSVVDVPLKRGIAKTDMPAYNGAVISVASGVVLGNEIHWRGSK